MQEEYFGAVHGGCYLRIYNSYNAGNVTGSSCRGGVIGSDIANRVSGIGNNYWLSGTAYYGRGSTGSNSNAVAISSTNLQKYTVALGNAYVYDVYNKNNGYPVLSWENNKTVMKLNKNQEYIKVRRNFEPKCSRDRSSNKNYRK